MGPWGLLSSFQVFSTLPALFPLPLRRFFFLPWNDFAEPYRQSDWFLCLHRPLRRASDNELLLLKWRAWEGWFSCALTTSRALDEKWSLGAYTLKTVSLKNITLWPGIMNDKHLELVLQIHFLMKKIATALLVSETSIHFQTLGQKGRTFGEEPLFLHESLAVSLCFVLLSKQKKNMAGIKSQAYETNRVYHYLLISIIHGYCFFLCACGHTTHGESISWILGWTSRKKLLGDRKLKLYSVWVSPYVHHTAS